MEELQPVAERWWSKDTIALVTGSNKGIGLQITRELAKRGLTTILTSRDEQIGRKAVESLREEGIDVDYHPLDITSSESVHRLVDWLGETYKHLDILVNNAGILFHTYKSPSRAEAQAVLETNYLGTRRMIEAVTPLMKPGARIINVSSKAGDLKYLKNEEWKAKLDDIPNLTVDSVDEFVEGYLDAAEKGEIASKGWSCFGADINMGLDVLSDYSTSKLALNAYSRIVAPELGKKGISINSMCPGTTSTSMTHFTGHPSEIGADTAVWLALLPGSEARTGKFFMGRTEVGFCDLPVFKDGSLFWNSTLSEVNNNLKQNGSS